MDTFRDAKGDTALVPATFTKPDVVETSRLVW